jgi:hypothetical protein
MADEPTTAIFRELSTKNAAARARVADSRDRTGIDLRGPNTVHEKVGDGRDRCWQLIANNADSDDGDDD